jgi:ferredoxin
MGKNVYILDFSPRLIKEPVTFRLVRDFDLEINILRADINERGGHLLLEIDGARREEGLDYLRNSKVEVKELLSLVKKDEGRCSDCGMCVSICPFESYSLEKGEDYKVVFHSDRCIACGLCLDACPTGALTMLER